MRIKNILLPVLLGLLINNTISAQVNLDSSYLKVEGEVAKSIKLTASDLSKMKRLTVNLRDRDGKDHQYTGVSVLDILNLAGVTTGKELRGENLSKYLLVRCADGYEVLFSLAEMDTAFTSRISILADESEGKPLPAGKGPFRLVVPGEGRPARSCFQVVEFVIRFAKE